MANIGNLVVNVLANTSPFQRGMNRSRRSLSRFQRSAETTSKITRNLGRTFAVVGGAIIAGRLVTALRRTADEIDRVAKTSQKLGLTTEALIGLRFAAQTTGVQARTLEMGMQRASRRISEAAKGTGEARGALRELGLDARRLNRLAPDEQLIAIAAAMSQVTRQSDRIRLGFKLFDSEGVDLIRTLELGERRLRNLVREAEALGGTFSEAEAQKVERFNDALTRLSLLAGSFKRDLVISIAPRAERWVDDLREVLTGFRLMFGDRRGDSNFAASVKESARGLFSAQGTLFRDSFSKAFEPVVGRLTEIATKIDLAVGSGTNSRNPQVTGRPELFPGLGLRMRIVDAQLDQVESDLGQVKKFIRDFENRPKQPIFRAALQFDRRLAELGMTARRVTRDFDDFARWIDDLNRRGRFAGLRSLPGKIFQSLFPFRRERAEAQDTAVFRGVNRALERGTLEAFRAAHARNSPAVQIAKQQLVEDKRHTNLLEELLRNNAQAVAQVATIAF